MYTTMIFDFDGLLVDSEQMFYKIFNDLLQENNCRSLDLKEYTMSFSGHSTVDNANRLINDFHLPMETMPCVDEIHDRAENNKEVIPLKKGVKELLAYLKEHHYNIVIATSSVSSRVNYALEMHGLTDYFMGIANVGDSGKSKPAPDVYLNAAALINARPEECLAFEDSEAGILSAHNAGMDVICVPDLKEPGQSFKDLSKAVLPSLLDVIDLLEKETQK